MRRLSILYDQCVAGASANYTRVSVLFVEYVHGYICAAFIERDTITLARNYMTGQ